MKNYLKYLCLAVMALCLLPVFSGCSNIKIDEPDDIRAGVETFMEALLEPNGEAAYAVVTHEISHAEFQEKFVEMRTLVSDVQEYELTVIGLHYNVNNGVKTTQVHYRMTTNAGAFVIATAASDGHEGLTSFYIVPEEQTNLVYTGTLGHMQGADVLQWFVLLTSVLSWGFVIWMVVDCCRRPIQKKILWILLIILGGMLYTWSASGGSVASRINFGIYIQLNALLRYGDGSTKLSLLVPLGAIIYCTMRKKLSAAEKPRGSADVPEISEPVSGEEMPVQPEPEITEQEVGPENTVEE